MKISESAVVAGTRTALTYIKHKGYAEVQVQTTQQNMCT